MFTTLRSRLIISYAAVVILALGVALLGTLLLARVYSERNDFEALHEKAALAFPFVQLELTNPRRPLPQQLLNRVRDNVRISGVRILFVDAATMTIVEDSSLRLQAVGRRFPVDDLNVELGGLYRSGGVEGKSGLPGENGSYLYVAYRLLGYVAAPRADGMRRDTQPLSGAQAQAGPREVIVVFAEPERGIRGLARELLDSFGLAALLALLLALAAAYWLARSISRPVARLAEGARSIAKGDYGQQLPVEGRDELAVLTERFNEMAAEVGRAHRMERDFVANISHDLKTPLTSIQGFSQAMVDGSIVDESGYRQAAAIINSEAERMARLVSDLLNLSRLQNQLQRLETRPVRLDTLLSQIVLAMKPQAHAGGVSLNLESQVQDIWVIADEDRLKQALGNLLDNAVKYTPSGGSVRVGAERAHHSLARIVVQDTGQGIPGEDLPRVTERFYQVDKSRSPAERKSAGLGLAIAQEIIRAHGGQMAIESREGFGTKVTVLLPLPGGQGDADYRGGMPGRLQAGRTGTPSSVATAPPTGTRSGNGTEPYDTV